MNNIHLIGNAHIDPVWLWSWQEGFSEIKATFKAALDRMEQFDDFIFTCAGASYYKWVEENEPDLFEQIKKRVQEGRWVVAGGWWLQPDCNLPCGESFARHGLYGQRYLLEKFGVLSTFGYNVDSFGHNGMLPQLLSKCGMDSYVFMRPDANEKDMESNLFWWKSDDGSKVLTYRLPNGYGCDWSKENIDNKYTALCKMAEEQSLPMMYFYGVGNHGGGPTISCMNILNDIMAEKPEDNTMYSSPKSYFEQIRNGKYRVLEYKGDLQHHASGCYSAMSQIKRDNRRSENRLIAAEKMLTIANQKLGLPYDDKGIKKAWENAMFNQFHDILGGCSIKEAYEDAQEWHGESLKISGDILNASLQKISWNIDTMKEHNFYLTREFDWTTWEHEVGGTPMVVFNTLAWEVDATVRITRNCTAITDDEGNSYELQSVRASKTNGMDKYEAIFNAKIPALGYKVFYGFGKKQIEPTKSANELIATDNTIENKWFKLEIEPHTGYIVSLLDKKNNTQVFSRPAGVPVVIDDFKADTWAHGITTFNDVVGKFADATVKLIEIGAIKATIRVSSKYGASSIIQDITMYKDKKDIDVDVRLNWQEKHKILKLSFPSNTVDNTATYEIPYGVIEKEADGQEEAGLNWANVTGKAAAGKTRGISIVNNAKYSYDVTGNDLRFIVARSAMFADHYGVRDEFAEFIDQGVQYLSYSIAINDGELCNHDVIKKAYELNNPVITIYETYHKGELGTQDSYATIDAPNVVLSVIKKSEDGDATIVRLYETDGNNTKANVSLDLLGVRFETELTPYEIKTLKIDNSKVVTKVNILEM